MTSDWIVTAGDGPQGGAKCLRCGAELKVVLPCIVQDWCDAMKAFCDRHQQCPNVKAK